MLLETTFCLRTYFARKLAFGVVERDGSAVAVAGVDSNVVGCWESALGFGNGIAGVFDEYGDTTLTLFGADGDSTGLGARESGGEIWLELVFEFTLINVYGEGWVGKIEV